MLVERDQSVRLFGPLFAMDRGRTRRGFMGHGFMGSKRVAIRSRFVDRERKSIWSWNSWFSALSVLSLFSFASVFSLASSGSILSIGSNGSILSIGSAGSILSIGSAGSILSIGAVGGFLQKGRPKKTPQNVNGSELLLAR